MGFTIGSGGGPPPDDSVSEDKIVDKAVSEDKLSDAVVAQLGGGGESWQVATQASNGNTLTLTLSPTGAEFEILIEVLSQTNGSLIEIELNNSTGSYVYYTQYNGVPDAGVGSYILAGAVAAGNRATISGVASVEDTIAKVVVQTGTMGVGVSQSLTYKTLGTPADLSAITVKSSGANGIGAGSFIKARKIG